MKHIRSLEFPLSDGGFELLSFYDIRSSAPGPVLAAVAAQHGNELNGCAVIRQFARHCSENPEFRGRLIGVPFANPFALRRRRPNSDMGPEQPYTETTRNMQTHWNTTDGNEIIRLAHFWWEKLLSEADMLVDIHCYPKFNAPVIVIRPNSEKWETLARISGLPQVRYLKRETDWNGSLRCKAEDAGKICLGIELCGQYEIFDAEVDRGIRVLENLCRHLKMLPGEPEIPLEPPVVLESRVPVYAPISGLFIHRRGIASGIRVKKGDELGVMVDTATLEEIAIHAPEAGYLTTFAGRSDSDVSLRGHHRYCFVDDILAVIVPVGG
ncbi:MAG: Succinylglutamate desuccinylase / Aspartoacylase family protein [Lentisphaerae bacterium ADurb.Bin242]|nr:MAG: Succinylglutamate desuccinylase / Aspartoacylase family protein [Lentisphaerae bacterium ADurb.Bin242]